MVGPLRLGVCPQDTALVRVSVEHGSERRMLQQPVVKNVLRPVDSGPDRPQSVVQVEGNGADIAQVQHGAAWHEAATIGSVIHPIVPFPFLPPLLVPTMPTTTPLTPLSMPIPSGEQLKAARLAAGLNQAQAAELMGYSLQTGSRGGLQSRTWQALESTTDERNMQGPVFAMFLLLTGQHPTLQLVPRETEAPDTSKSPDAV